MLITYMRKLTINDILFHRIKFHTQSHPRGYTGQAEDWYSRQITVVQLHPFNIIRDWKHTFFFVYGITLPLLQAYK